MSQSIVDFLLSAGGTLDVSTEELRLFYIDADGVLTYRVHTQGSVGPPTIVTSPVKQDSSAAYVPKNPQLTISLIICVTPSSTLRVLHFDENTNEWADINSYPKPTGSIGPSGQIAIEIGGRMFYQDPDGKLIVAHRFKTQPLPANPIASTPLYVPCYVDHPMLFYIAQDNFVHYLTYKNDSWVDTVVAEFSFDTLPKRIVASVGLDGTVNGVFAIINSTLVSITKSGKSVVGRVTPDGKLLPIKTGGTVSNVVPHPIIGGFLHPCA